MGDTAQFDARILTAHLAPVLASKSGFIQRMKPKYRLYSCDFSTENTFPFGKLAKNALANLRTRIIQRFLNIFSLLSGGPYVFGIENDVSVLSLIHI